MAGVGAACDIANILVDCLSTRDGLYNTYVHVHVYRYIHKLLALCISTSLSIYMILYIYVFIIYTNIDIHIIIYTPIFHNCIHVTCYIFTCKNHKMNMQSECET